MRLKSRITEVLLAFLSIISPAIAFAQVNPTSPVPQRESIQELLNRLTPQQKQQFDNAGKSYKENQFVEAFAIYKRLLTELSGDAILSKFASEAGLIPETTALPYPFSSHSHNPILTIHKLL